VSRESPRPRRHIPPKALAVLKPFLRFSDSRQAYVLRGVGNRFGPVLAVPRTKRPAPDKSQH
jgi:hypothetical protein